MKKILLTAAATTVLATSSAMAMGMGDFYGSLYGGVNMLSDVKDVDGKHKSETAGHMGVAVGYYMNEMLRADLAFEHLFDPKFKKSGKNSFGDKFNAKAKAEVNALMLNVYADLYDAGMAKFYLGAGVGAARNRVKYNMTYPDMPTDNYSFKTKEKTDFAYALHAGASTEFAPGVNGFLQYSWKDYGKTNKKASLDGEKVELNKAYNLRGHHGSLGVRVDF